MKRKLLAVILSVSLLSAVLAGGQLESGKVALRVWVEESNIDNLQKMIDSFQQKYAGQADLDITIEVSGDADTRANVLKDIHNAADVFSMPDDQLFSLIAGGALSPVGKGCQSGGCGGCGIVQ